jgi:hypothetical protein
MDQVEVVSVIYQLLNLIDSRWDFMDGESANRKAATYTRDRINTD